MNSVLQKDIEYFIDNFEKKSQIELVEGKEKTELTKIAEGRGMKIKGSRDLAIFKTVYAFTDRPNKNGAVLPQKELLKVLPQIIGKPISVNHNRRFVVGHYVDYKYIQKENKIIAYGVFYKSNFGEEWEQAKLLFKQKRLSSSFEIWSPKKAYKDRGDGTYELRQMEIAGGALIFQDADNEPAFDGADVLSIAKRIKESEPELVYASRHKEDEIIGADVWKDSVEENLRKREAEKEVEKEAEAQPPVAPVAPVVPKVQCQNCQEEFETIEVTNIKCPKCFAIVKNTGEILYPPQIKDFNVNCPNCSQRDWLIVSNGEETSDIRCKGCAKEYTIKYAKPSKDEFIDKIPFVYTGHVGCPQCQTRILISGVSDTKEHEIVCTKCKLKFRVNTEKLDKTRSIESIEEKASEERRKEQEMKEKQEEKKEVEVKEEIKVEKTETPKEEEKVEEVKVEEPKAEEPKEAPKAEEVKAEPVTKSSEDKTEEVVETKENEEAKEAVAEQPSETPSEDSTKPQEEKSEDTSTKETIEETQVETQETNSEEIEVVDVDDAFFDTLEQSKKLTNESRKLLSDDSFAVVKLVKSTTGKTRKVRMLPIHDRAHVRNAYARLSLASKTLKKLGVDSRVVTARILKQAKKLGMKNLIKSHVRKAHETRNYRKAIRTLVDKVVKLKKSKKLEVASVTVEADKSKQDEIAKINIEADKKIEFYQANANVIAERRLELGEEYSQSLTDKDIVDDDKFAKVQLEKENALYRANAENTSDDVGVKSALGRDDDYYSKIRTEIDDKAFPNNKEKN